MTLPSGAGIALSLLLVGGIVACGDSGGTSETPTTPTPAAATQPTPMPAAPSEYGFLQGEWSGQWVDTRFGVQGTLRATFTVAGSDVAATGVIGLQSLGLGNETGLASGTIEGDRLSFTFEAQTVGNGQGEVSAGAGSGRGTVLGALNFGDFTFEGTADETGIDGTFQFSDPAGGRGTARLTKN